MIFPALSIPRLKAPPFVDHFRQRKLRFRSLMFQPRLGTRGYIPILSQLFSCYIPVNPYKSLLLIILPSYPIPIILPNILQLYIYIYIPINPVD